MRHEKERMELIEYARRLNTSGLSRPGTGNISIRLTDSTLAATPSGISYATLMPDDIVLFSERGSLIDEVPRYVGVQKRKVTSEWRLHLLVMQVYTWVRAVVHCHPRYTRVLACRGRGIPLNLTYEMFPLVYLPPRASKKTQKRALSGEVRCTQYQKPGSSELAESIIPALADRRACIVCNHGAVAVGASLAEAYKTAEKLEEMADLWLLTGADYSPVPGHEMLELPDVYANHGQPKKE